MNDPLITSRDPKRIMAILIMIDSIWRRNPDLRLGQLLSLVTAGNMETRLFYYEDDDLFQHLKAYWESDTTSTGTTTDEPSKYGDSRLKE